MITRTFVITLADCMVVHGETVSTDTIKLNGKLSYDETTKYIRKHPAVVDGIFVMVKSVNYEEKMFGISEHDFLKYGIELDDKRKPLIPVEG